MAGPLRIKGRVKVPCLPRSDKTSHRAPQGRHTGVGRRRVSRIQQAQWHSAEVNLPRDCALKTRKRGPARGVLVNADLGAVEGPTTALKSSSTSGTKGSF